MARSGSPNFMNMLMRVALVFLLFAANAIAQEQPVVRYKNLRAARAANVLTEGWLPDWMPASTSDIELHKQTKTGFGAGRLSISSKDLSVFFEHLKYCAEWLEPPNQVKSDLGNARAQKETVYQFDNDGAVWLFACREEGSCRFWKWQHMSDT